MRSSSVTYIERKGRKLLKFLLIAILIIAAICISEDIVAQCPMCKAGAESNLQNGGKEGKGLNLGIGYMFAAPYLIVTTLVIVWWRNRPD